MYSYQYHIANEAALQNLDVEYYQGVYLSLVSDTTSTANTQYYNSITMITFKQLLKVLQ